jgi:hypothetical protein
MLSLTASAFTSGVWRTLRRESEALFAARNRIKKRSDAEIGAGA